MIFWIYPFQGTHPAGSCAEWDAATPNTLEVRSDRSWLSWAHFGGSVIAQPPIFGLSRGGAHPKRIARLLYPSIGTSKNEYEKVPMSCNFIIRGGRPQAISTSWYIGRTAKIRSSLPGHLPPQRRFAAIIEALGGKTSLSRKSRGSSTNIRSYLSKRKS